MKTLIHASKSSFFVSTFAALLAAAAVGRAQPAPQPAAAAPAPDAPRAEHHHGDRKIILRHGEPAGPIEKESVTFLGVETAPVSRALSAQLNLPQGAGLVVSHVVPESPANGALQPYDVLLKLDDQQLIEPRQFSVLVRNHQDGDQVTLTYVRGGKQATATVKLTKHEVQKMAFFHHFEGPGEFGFSTGEPGEIPDEEREEMDHVLALMRRGDGPVTKTFQDHLGGNVGFRATQVNPANSNLVFNDEKGSLDLTIKDGKKTLVAKNPKGESVFSGPVTTPEERKAIPDDLRERLEHIEGMQDFSFETGEDFQDHLRVVEPDRVKISLPKKRVARPMNQPL